MFFGCLAYTLQVKSGPFHEHSNQLWNISGAQNWTKVNGGLVKMYKAEVLAKFPVIQHTFFGSLFSVAERVGGGGGGGRVGLPPRLPSMERERRTYVPNPNYPDQPTSPTVTSPHPTPASNPIPPPESQ
jgi:serine/threonine-protein phosphatase 2A activator